MKDGSSQEADYYDRAIALRSRLYGENHSRTLEAVIARATYESEEGEESTAGTMMESIEQSLPRLSTIDQMRALKAIGRHMRSEGRNSDGLEMLNKGISLSAHEDAAHVAPAVLGGLYRERAIAQNRMGRGEEAVADAARSLEIFESWNPSGIDTADALHMLAMSGPPSQLLSLETRATDIVFDVYGRTGRIPAEAFLNLGIFMAEYALFPQALEKIREAKRAYGDAMPDAWERRASRIEAVELLAMDRAQESLAILYRVRQDARRVGSGDPQAHQEGRMTTLNIINALLATRQYQEAKGEFEGMLSLAATEGTLPTDDSKQGAYLNVVHGHILHGLGDLDGAIREWEIALSKAGSSGAVLPRIEAKFHLAQALWDLGGRYRRDRALRLAAEVEAELPTLSPSSRMKWSEITPWIVERCACGGRRSASTAEK